MLQDIYTLIIAQVVANNLNILSELFSLLIKLLGLRSFTIIVNGRTSLTNYIKKGFYTSDYIDIPGGIVCGLWYYGFIKKMGFTDNIYTINIVCSELQWNLMNGINKLDGFDHDVEHYVRHSGLKTIKSIKLTPRTTQNTVMNKIMNIYNKQRFAAVFITGPPGAGKTKIATLLAQAYNMTMYKTSVERCINHMGYDYFNIAPSRNKPLVVLLDEVDESVTKIFKPDNTDPSLFSTRKEEDKITKRSWNELFDSINDGIFPYAIFILISNLSKNEIDEMNNSLLREGRINLSVNMTKDNVKFS